MQRTVKEFLGKDDTVTAVVLDDGSTIGADIVILGAGIIPATNFISAVTAVTDGTPSAQSLRTSIEKFRDQSIVVDEYMRAAVGVYAAGDIARFPYFHTGEKIRVEHYGMSQYQGAIAAHSFAGKPVPARSVPFFWTVQYGKSIRYAGHAFTWDTIYIDGELENYKFAAYFIKGDTIDAVASIGRDPLVSAAAELFQLGKMPPASAIRSDKFDLVDFLRNIK